MIPTDKQYWADYAHMPSRTVVEAVQLTEPTLIDGKTFESGDWSVKANGAFMGMTDQAFKKECRQTFEWDGEPEFDKDKNLLEQMDDMIVQIARLTCAMERYGMINDPSQK